MRQCSSCKNPISSGRLKAVPSASKCTLCQSIEDTQVAAFQPPSYLSRVGGAGRFESDEVSTKRRLRLNVATHGLASAIAGGFGY